MAGRLRNVILSGLTYGLLLVFSTMSVVTATPRCRGNEPQILKQSSLKAEFMFKEASILFNSSVDELNFLPEMFDGNLDWFPQPVFTNMSNIQLLQNIYQTLNHFCKALKVFYKYLSTNSTKDFLLRILNANTNVHGLLSNIKCILILKNIVPKNTTSLEIPKDLELFEQKEQFCQLLKLYMDFMKNVKTIMKCINKKTNINCSV